MTSANCWQALKRVGPIVSILFTLEWDGQAFDSQSEVVVTYGVITRSVVGSDVLPMAMDLGMARAPAQDGRIDLTVDPPVLPPIPCVDPDSGATVLCPQPTVLYWRDIHAERNGCAGPTWGDEPMATLLEAWRPRAVWT